MRIRGANFTITSMGEAMEDGRPGEFIRIRNISSRRIITAKVTRDGAVEPVYQEARR
jgi:flagella basal body P-ring formation protein FlgA